MRDGRGWRKISQQPFPYPVSGRFTYILSAMSVHCPFFVMLGFLGQCSFISDSLFVNSRTPDIGKVFCLILRQPLFTWNGNCILLLMLWVVCVMDLIIMQIGLWKKGLLGNG